MLLLTSVCHRADLRCRQCWVALHERGGLVRKRGGETIGEAFVDEDPLGAHANLTCVAKTVACSECRRGLKICVFQDDQSILAAEFKDESLQPACGLAHNVFAGRATPDECDQVDLRGHKRLALDLVAMNNLQHPRGELRHQSLRPRSCAERRLLAGLEHHSVSRNEAWDHHILWHQDGKVPRRDASRDPKWIEAKF